MAGFSFLRIKILVRPAAGLNLILNVLLALLSHNLTFFFKIKIQMVRPAAGSLPQIIRRDGFLVTSIT